VGNILSPSMLLRANVITLLAFFCVMLLAIIFPAHALTFNSPTGNINCEVGASSFSVKVVYCVKMAVFATTQLFLAQTTALMQPVIGVFMILVFVLLGVRIAIGEQDPQKMVLGTLLKFGIVWLLADNFGAAMGGLTAPTFQIMEQLQAFVIPPLYSSGTCTLGASGLNGGYIDPVTFAPWEYIDCIFDYIFGFGIQATIASSIFGFIGSTFFSGSIGMMVFFIGIILVLSLALFAFRTVYIVMMSYIYVGLLIILTPLFAWALMFKVTEYMFTTWMRNIIGGMCMPFFMITYLAFAMPLLDSFVFDSDPQSLTSTLGRDNDITSRYRLAAPICELKTPSDFDFFSMLSSNKIIGDILTPTKSGSGDPCAMADFSKVDMGKEHIQKLWEIGMSLLRILAVTFLILTIATQIPELCARVVGGGFSLSGSANNPMLFETAIKGGLRTAMKGSMK
jgi:uncharacterized membrane protein